MIFGVYSIFDAAAGIFTSPTVDISDESAMRSFLQACSNSQSIMNFKPSDFSLYQVGYFDSDTGELNSIFPPSRLKVCDGDIVKGAKV